jgi:nucleotide-binding universal stress UspA family protein
MIPPLAVDGGFYSLEADWTNAMRETIEERLKAARAAFDAATNELGACASFCCGLQLPVPAMAAASRAADLIVAGGAPRRMHDAYRDCAAAELAITSGRPVLVAPPAPPPLSAKQVLLAWKDSREARRAMSDAIPFFEQAERVVVAAVVGGGDAAAARLEVGQVVAALQRRGIKAEGKVVEHAHPAQQILEQARQAGADLIVCGAYGHSRLGEWAFGGVTQDLLSQDQVYLLLSH